MYIYLLFFFTVLIAFVDIFYPTKQRGANYQVVYWSMVVLFFFFSAFRVDRGGDWPTYEEYFVEGYWATGGYMEWGYNLLNAFAYAISTNYQVMVFLVSAMIFLIKPRWIYRFSVYPMVSLMAWFALSFGDLFPIRQSISFAFVLWSVYYIQQRRFWPFMALVVCAMAFHYSAAVFIPAYYVYKLRFNKWVMFAAFVGLYAVMIAVADRISDMLGAINNPFVQERLAAYLGSSDEMFGSKRSLAEVLLRGFVNRSIIFFLILFVFDNLHKQNKEVNGWGNLYMFGSFLFPLFVPISVAFSRLSHFYDLSIYFLLAYLFILPAKQSSKIIIFVLVTLYLLYRLSGMTNDLYDLYIPYKSVFYSVI